MLGKIIGATIGAKVAGNENEASGKGAAIGFLAPAAIKTMAKIGALAAVGFGVLSLVKAARN